MNECRKSQTWRRLPGRAVLGAFTLCGLCCALPILGGVLGAGTLVVAAIWLEWVAMGVFALAIVALLWMGVRLLATRRCETNCGCANAGDQADN